MEDDVQKIEKEIEKEFHASWYIILYKLILGILELISGIGIIIFGDKILEYYSTDLARELSEDPHDILAQVTSAIIPHLFGHNTYIVFYLIILGIAKIAGSIGLIYKKNWGVDLLVGLTLVMLPFQLVNLVLHPALFDFLYISFGILISLYLIEFKPRAWISRLFLR